MVMMKKATFFKKPPAGPAFVRKAVAFTPHRQYRHGKLREDLFSEGQGLGVAVVGQVPGEEHQMGRRPQRSDLGHRPGQGPGLIAAGVAIFQMRIG
jgi:hypothetical protein